MDNTFSYLENMPSKERQNISVAAEYLNSLPEENFELNNDCCYFPTPVSEDILTVSEKIFYVALLAVYITFSVLLYFCFSHFLKQSTACQVTC